MTSLRTVGLVARFGLAGLANTVVGFGVIAALDLGLSVEPRLANAAGYGVGVLVSFALNRGFVFRSQSTTAQVAPRFVTAVAAAFAVNQAVLWASGAALGPGVIAHAAAQLAAMASYTILLFLACRFWVFRAAN